MTTMPTYFVTSAGQFKSHPRQASLAKKYIPNRATSHDAEGIPSLSHCPHSVSVDAAHKKKVTILATPRGHEARSDLSSPLKIGKNLSR